MDKMKFIQDEIWLVTFNAAFQRANVYKKGADEQQKMYLRNMLKGDMELQILSDYQNEVSDERHLENIYSIKTRSQDFYEILNNGSFSFGVCQKILNLYLKFQWCLDRIKLAPPHFPVDRRIQIALKIQNIVSWTTEMGEEEYMAIIKTARGKLKQFNMENIAELELFLFERRSNS
jgi:hypothetical protein